MRGGGGTFWVLCCCVGKLLPQMTKKIRENTQEKKRMSFTYINPRSIPKRGTHEETPRGGNWLSHKFSNTSAFTNKTRFILLVGIPRFLKHNLIWKKMFLPLCKKKWADFIKMQPCRILWFLMKVKPKTKISFAADISWYMTKGVWGQFLQNRLK